MKPPPHLDSSALFGRTKRCFNGFTVLLMKFQTRRRRSRRQNAGRSGWLTRASLSLTSRVAVDETAITIGTDRYWVYAAIDLETKLLLDVSVSRRRGTDPAAAFLGQLAEKHDVSETTFLVDGMGYPTALARCDLSGHLDYVMRNLIEKWFQTLSMRIDRFHQTWMGGRASAARWLTASRYYYNTQRPNHALDNRTPAEEVMKS